MAGKAKPNVKFLGCENKIIVTDYKYRGCYNRLKFDKLFDENINNTAVLFNTHAMNGVEYVEFKVEKLINIWAIGKHYSDTGGPSGNIVKLYKKQANGTFLYVKDLQTYDNMEWYILAKNLSSGIYKISSINKYALFNEWYIESLNLNLIKSNNKYYIYQNNEFIEIEPNIENFEQYSINLSQLTMPTNKAVLTMKNGEVLEDGKLFRKTININKYRTINNIKVI